MKIVALCSGGIDSYIACEYHKRNISNNDEIIPIYIDYKGMICQKEIEAVNKLYKDPIILSMDLSRILGCHWSITGDKKDFPFADKDVKKEFIPARNILFLSFLLPVIYNLGIDTILVGKMADDVMPDNQVNFYSKFKEMATIGMGKRIEILMPIHGLRKRHIIKYADNYNISLKDTWSCYDNKELHCGVCHQCIERRIAFKDAGIEDSIKYLVYKEI